MWAGAMGEVRYSGLRPSSFRTPGIGSVSEAAATYGREHGIMVIDGGCPCMFDPTADLGHKVMRFVFTLNGNAPKAV